MTSRSGLARGAVFYWLGRSRPLLLTACDSPGSWTLMFLEAWLGGGRGARSGAGAKPSRRRRRVLLMEFIRRRPAGWRLLVFPLWFNLIARPAVRRAMLAGQVLTEWELARYARMFAIPPQRLVFIPYPLADAGDRLPPFEQTRESNLVLSSGRAACDWETLFRAAAGRGWPLTVVCTAKDLPRVNKMNFNGRARVLSDITFEEHAALLRQAAVYVISMNETEGSTGQVRLSNAIRAGAPVVATAIMGLEGYIRDGETCLSVPPGDWRRMGDAVDRLLAEPAERKRLRQAAFGRAARWTYRDYFKRIGELVERALAESGPAGGGR